MKKLFVAASTYLALGLVAGVFYREFTKIMQFDTQQETQLSVVHTHLLALGFLFFLIALALEKSFALSVEPTFSNFFVFYNVGLVISTSMMVTNGVLDVLGVSNKPELIALASGFGHILLALGLALFMMTLGRAIKR